MQNMNQEFKEALSVHKSDELRFTKLIDKVEELKTVLQSNFRIKVNKRKWYGKCYIEYMPVLNVSIDEKINHSTGNYLYINIDGNRHVMGIGEIGDLKDKLYFCEGRYTAPRDSTIVFVCSSHVMFNTINYCLEDKITLVQLFSKLIKQYKHFLVEAK